MKIHIADTFPVSRHTFVYGLFFDDDFNVALHEHLDFKERNILAREETEETVFMRIEYIPTRELPKVIRKLLRGGSLGYVEDFTFYKRDWLLQSLIKPMTLGNRIESRGVMRFLEAGPHACERVYDIDVSVNVPLAGGVIERTMAKDVKASFQKTATFTEAYIRDRKLY